MSLVRRRDAKAMIVTFEDLAVWSDWIPFAEVLRSVPRSPGVYQAREGKSGPLVYVGMAGERHGHGLWGRFSAYASGRGMVRGLGEAVLDRALADPEWLRQRLAEVEDGQGRPAKVWSCLAFERAGLHVRWATTGTREAAIELERACQERLGAASLWNRRV